MSQLCIVFAVTLFFFHASTFSLEKEKSVKGVFLYAADLGDFKNFD